MSAVYERFTGVIVRAPTDGENAMVDCDINHFKDRIELSVNLGHIAAHIQVAAGGLLQVRRLTKDGPEHGVLGFHEPVPFVDFKFDYDANVWLPVDISQIADEYTIYKFGNLARQRAQVIHDAPSQNV